MENFPLQPYDALMLVVLVCCTVFGAWKGMAWQIAALASLLVSGAVAIQFSRPLAPYFGNQVPWNWCLAMLVLYLITGVAIWLVFRVVANIIDRVRLKEFDRQVGAIFGAAKGLLWCLIITFFSVTLSERLCETILKTHSGVYAAKIIHVGVPLLPVEVHQKLEEYIEQFHEKIHPDTPLPALRGSSSGDRSGETLFP